jgi:hypothetical protein
LVSVGSQNFPKVAIDAGKLLRDVNNVKNIITKLEFLNFEVLTADPNFKIPERPTLPEVPELPKTDFKVPELPDVPDISIPSTPDIKKFSVEDKLKNLKK